MFRLHRANSRFFHRRKTETAKLLIKKTPSSRPRGIHKFKLPTMLQAGGVVGLDGFRAEVDLCLLEAVEDTNSIQ